MSSSKQGTGVPAGWARSAVASVPLPEVLLALVVFAAASLSKALTGLPDGIAMLWPGSIIAAAILIRRRDVRWTLAALLLWLSLFLSDLLVPHRAWPIAAALATVGLAEIALMVAPLRLVWRFSYPDLTVGQATFLTGLLGAAAPAIAALGAGAVLSVGYGRPFSEGAVLWWSSHLLGACLFGPPIFLFSHQAIRRLLSAPFRLENAAWLLVCTVGDYLAIRYLKFPLVLMSVVLLISAFRLGGFGVSVMSLATGLTSCTLWLLGIRPLGLQAAAPLYSLVGLPVVPVLAALMPAMAVGLGSDARRAVARQLRASERQFREAMENSPIGILIADLDGTWRHCNRSLCLMLGYSAEELRTLPPGGPSSQTDWQASRERWGRLLSGEIDYYDVERRFQHKDGRWIWAHVAVSVMRDEAGAPAHLIAQIESLEARREASQRIAEERERLITTLQSITEAVITTDSELRVTYLNTAAEELLGVRRSDVEHRRVDELLHLTDPSTLKSATNLISKSIVAGRVVTRDSGCVLHRPDGTVIYVRDSVSPVVGPRGLLAGTVIVLRNVSEDMARELKLLQQATQDSLTGLMARSEFRRTLREVLAKSHHKDRPAALIAIDLDRFKLLNDAAGHAAGDAMLCKVAETCRAVVRASDTVARLGGDEFAILLQDCAEARARVLCEELSRALNPLELSWHGARLSVGASIGVAMLSPAMASEEQWLIAADQACYLVKREGRGQVRFAI